MNTFVHQPTLDTLELPLDETQLVMMSGLIHEEVSPESVNEESSAERRS